MVGKPPFDPRIHLIDPEDQRERALAGSSNRQALQGHGTAVNAIRNGDRRGSRGGLDERFEDTGSRLPSGDHAGAGGGRQGLWNGLHSEVEHPGRRGGDSPNSNERRGRKAPPAGVEAARTAGLSGLHPQGSQQIPPLQSGGAAAAPAYQSDDEALARQLQEELLEAERRVEEDDMYLALKMQNQENAFSQLANGVYGSGSRAGNSSMNGAGNGSVGYGMGTSGGSGSGMGVGGTPPGAFRESAIRASQNVSGGDGDVEAAIIQSLMEGGGSGAGPPAVPHPVPAPPPRQVSNPPTNDLPQSGSRTPRRASGQHLQDDDHELARRMQELEAAGMGSVTDLRSSDPSDYERMRRQLRDDETLARNMAMSQRPQQQPGQPQQHHQPAPPQTQTQTRSTSYPGDNSSLPGGRGGGGISSSQTSASSSGRSAVPRRRSSDGLSQMGNMPVVGDEDFDHPANMGMPPPLPQGKARHQRTRSGDGSNMLGMRTGSLDALNTDFSSGRPDQNPSGVAGGTSDVMSSSAPTTNPPPPDKGKKRLFRPFMRFRGRNAGNADRDNSDTASAPPEAPAFVPNPVTGHPSEGTEPTPNPSPGPIPHSLSINRSVPISPRPEAGGGNGSSSNPGATPTSAPPTQPKKKIPFSRNKQSSVPTCAVCGKIALSYLSTLGKKYHHDCFKCMGCHQVINPNGPFAYTTDEHGEKCPLHRKCYAELFGIKCAVCKESIPAGPDGKVSYVKHPFFETEQMCPRHASEASSRRCTGCHRFEPQGGEGFADLGDANRCVCLACCRSVIVDSDDAKPLWDTVINFFEHKLGLPIWAEMREIPVLVVGYDALNDQLQGTAHSESSQIMTRGLCLSEHQSGRRIALPRMRFDKKNRSFKPRDVEAKGYTFYQVPDASKINPDSSVTAILCLSGLPADLTASVLAHEATHAWIKLHPNFSVTDPMPLQVEEGCCQLMAHLFLTDGLPPPATTESSEEMGPSDEKLRQYFKFSIETDDNAIYGEGYRLAAEAYANIGIEALLSHVVMYRSFPKV